MFKIWRTGRHWRASILLYGLEVEFYFWGVYIHVPEQYKGEMFGMCGNFDDDPSNDDIGCDGTAGLSDNDLGDSCKTNVT